MDISKIFHIIFVVTWFSGLFYIVRLYIYHAMAIENNEDHWCAQYRLMEKRLWYGITWPSAILATGFGLFLGSYYWPWPSWLKIKFLWVLGLWSYQLLTQYLHKNFEKDKLVLSSYALRFWNEVATVFLFIIVAIVVFKDQELINYAHAGLAVLIVLLGVGILGYKKIRNGF